MFLLHVASLALTMTASAPSPATPPAQVVVVADTQPILTTDALTRMATFWTSFRKLPDSISTTGRKANQKKLVVMVGQRQATMPGVVDMVAMASKYPAVAEALKQSGLTAQEWENYRVALFTVVAAQQMDTVVSAPPTSALAKNAAFLTAHQSELTALKATGMWFPQFKTQPAGGGGADDLNP